MRLATLFTTAAAAFASHPAAAVSTEPQPMVAVGAAAAVAYWGHEPACGVPTVSIGDLGPNYDGMTWFADCHIEISDQIPKRYGDQWQERECQVMVHEYGHLELGPDAFPENTADPAHSLDPNNVMFADGGDRLVPECKPERHTIVRVQLRWRNLRSMARANKPLKVRRLPADTASKPVGGARKEVEHGSRGVGERAGATRPGSARPCSPDRH